MSKYIKYHIKTIQPLRISDDSKSQFGQSDTLKYIPGTTIRGFVVNSLVDDSDFKNIKKKLFSQDVRFLNAYITENGHELFPSPKGFYENKEKTLEKKKIENVLINGEYTTGFKRASLGDYCYFTKDCIHYYNIETGSNLKILVNEEQKNNVFRIEHIKKDYEFIGYIAVEEDEIANRIASLFTGEIIIGNARSQGLGKCRIVEKTEIVDNIPYIEYINDEDISNECYMMLLSDTVMLNNFGEVDGINVDDLADALNVSKIDIKSCATSTVNICGYNRKLRGKTSSIIAYEKGSVFKLEFPNMTIRKEDIRMLSDRGLGVNKNVGMGRVLFFKGFEKIGYKKAEKHSINNDQIITHSSDEEVLKMVARNYYKVIIEQAITEKINKKERFKENPSQIGRVRSIIYQNQYNAVEAKNVLEKFFKHEEEKAEKEHKHKNKDKDNIKEKNDYIKEVLKSDFDFDSYFEINNRIGETIFSIPRENLLTKEEIDRYIFKFILLCMSSDNRKGDK